MLNLAILVQHQAATALRVAMTTPAAALVTQALAGAIQAQAPVALMIVVPQAAHRRLIATNT